MGGAYDFAPPHGLLELEGPAGAGTEGVGGEEGVDRFLGDVLGEEGWRFAEGRVQEQGEVQPERAPACGANERTGRRAGKGKAKGGKGTGEVRHRDRKSEAKGQ